MIYHIDNNEEKSWKHVNGFKCHLRKFSVCIYKADSVNYLNRLRKEAKTTTKQTNKQKY